MEELNFDNVQRGLIQKRKIFNNNPQGIRGICLQYAQAALRRHSRPQGLDAASGSQADHRENHVQSSTSRRIPTIAGTPYENPDNPKNDYDPQEALKLLADAGWNSRDSQGRLVKNGAPLQIELLYDNKTFEPELTIYQEDLRKVGISLNLRLITPETQFQMVNERQVSDGASWPGADCSFPTPKRSGIPRSPT